MAIAYVALPQQVALVMADDVLLEAEVLRGDGLVAVRQAQQEPRHAEADVARVLRRAERLPLRVLRPLEDGLEVAQVRQLEEVLVAEERGTGGAEERRVRHRGDGGAVLEELDVLRAGAELVVREDGAVGLAAERAVLRGVRDPVKAALRDLGRVLEVRHEVVLRDVEQLDLDVLAEVGVVDEELEPAPRRLELLERRRGG